MNAFLAALFGASIAATPVQAGHTCRASYYGGEMHGRTASGARWNPLALTAAHPSLPFGTRVHVTFRGSSIVVVINDRGPSRRSGRCIDLSHGAARAIGLVRAGVGVVTLR